MNNDLPDHPPAALVLHVIGTDIIWPSNLKLILKLCPLWSYCDCIWDNFVALVLNNKFFKPSSADTSLISLSPCSLPTSSLYGQGVKSFVGSSYV